MRIVLDTNVLVSGLISPSGAPAQIQAAWRRGDFELVTSAPLLDELAEVLSYPRIRNRLGWTGEELFEFIEFFRATAIVTSPSESLELARDPDDGRVLEAAQASHADYVVTGDNDLLDLRTFVGIPILTPAVFLRLITPA